MMIKSILIILCCISFFSANAQLSIDIESGVVIPGYNDVRIPNDPSQATKFSFTEDFEIKGPVIPLRIRLNYSFLERNHMSILYAPLSIDYTGVQNQDINFQQMIFPAGIEIKGLYKFNSYRLTYRRDLISSEKWTFGLGFTAKIRDARVRLSTEDLSAKKDDIGFVPLLNLMISYQVPKWMFMLEGDGLGARQGRAFDFFLGASFKISNNLSLKTGYRILEGGANVGQVYNFTLLNFASVGMTWQFIR